MRIQGTDAVFSDVDLVLKGYLQIDALPRFQGRGLAQSLVILSVKAVLDLGDLAGKGLSCLSGSFAAYRLELHVISQDLQFVVRDVTGHFPGHGFGVSAAFVQQLAVKCNGRGAFIGGRKLTGFWAFLCQHGAVSQGYFVDRLVIIGFSRFYVGIPEDDLAVFFTPLRQSLSFCTSGGADQLEFPVLSSHGLLISFDPAAISS